MIQDKIIGGVVVVLSIALIPSVITPTVPWLTSVITGVALTTMAICYVTLGLRFSAITTAINAGMWLTILIRGLML